MNKFSAWLFLLLLLCLGTSPASAQDDLLKRLFDKEAPAFNVQVTPTADSGVVMMVLYFTHSKVSALEASVWIKDQGAQLSGEGDSRLVRGLHEIGNRQQDTFLVKGFVNRHFYTIGIDYRAAKSASAKFISKPIHDGYFYEFAGKPGTQRKPQNEAQRKADTADPLSTQTQPCQNPDVGISIVPYGYCGEDDYPAVLIDCTNCQGRNWEFSVEFRSEGGSWQTLRADGKTQTAFGNATRTEPLCALHPGVYKIRVATREKNCPSPVVYYADGTVVIADGAEQPIELPQQNNKPFPSDIDMVKSGSPALPDTCEVQAQAIVSGGAIRGSLGLSPNSPCGNMSPYVELRYVHPGYRDLTLPAISLLPGVPSAFEFKLDERDLERNIHTLQVVTFVNGPGKGIPISAFWVKAREPQIAAKSGEPKKEIATESPKKNEPTAAAVPSPPKQETSPAACNQIDDFRLVYLPGETDKPFYISWINPACCQQTGCQFMVWGGKLPGQLRLLAEGNKRGEMIKELLQGVSAADEYFEVILKLNNGDERRAAYIVGQGPIYGSDDIAQYQAKIQIQTKQQPKTPLTPPQTGTKGPAIQQPKAFEYATPSKAITDFSPCKYKRELILEAEMPIVEGDEIAIQYQFSEPGYQYSLYLQPTGLDTWVLAPGTEENHDKPSFVFETTPFHNGKYIMLIFKADKNWGCLSANPEEALLIKISE